MKIPHRRSTRRETLEARLPLTADLALDSVTIDPAIDEGDTVDVSFSFTDTVATGGTTIGIDPANPGLTSLGDLTTDDPVFAAISDLFINTSDEDITFTLIPSVVDPPTVTVPARSLWIDTVDGGSVIATGTVFDNDGAGPAPEVLAFLFDDFTLGAGYELTGVGSRPIALLATGSMDIDGVIDVSAQRTGDTLGQDDQFIPGAGGGAGGIGRADGSVPISVLDGQPALGAPVESSGVFKAGNATFSAGFTGSGAGFGGVGGDSNVRASNGDFSPGGIAYGDLELIGIQGGSGGGAGQQGFGRLNQGGDGGGGIELGALGDIAIDGQVLADAGGDVWFGRGRRGGGGAGGGILVHGDNVSLGSTSLLSASGVLGTPESAAGALTGEGAGGRILVAHSGTLTNDGTGNLVADASPTLDTAPEAAGSVITKQVTPVATAEDYAFTIELIPAVGSPVVLASGPVAVTTDGSSVTGSVDALGLSDALLGDDGLFDITVTVTSAEAGTANQTGIDSATSALTVNNVAPLVVAASGSVSGLEGDTLTTSGSFSDVLADPLTFTASIGTVTGDGLGGWNWSFDSDDDFAGTVTITANDGDGGLTDTTFDLTVDNVAPTVVAASDPVSGLEGDTLSASGSFADVLGDPLTFTASIGTVTGNGLGGWDWSFDSVDDFAGTVTITANDGDGGLTDTTFDLTVDNVAPELTVSNDSSVIFTESKQEGETVTLTGLYTDVGLLDTHTVTIDWGDGTVDADLAVAGGSFTPTHVYDDAGFYDVTVTLTDDDAGTTTEITQTVIAGVGVIDGVLVGIGTAGDDTFKVFRCNDHYAVLSRLDDGAYSWEVFEGPIDGIDLLLGPGHDIGFVSRRIDVNAFIDGGDGDDLLVGGRGDDILLGGAGYDLIFGQGGRDLQFGGADGDLMFGDGGQDILVSGTSAFDADREALDLILAEWASDRSYGERVDNITGVTSGGLNGDHFLIGEGENQTVFDDESTDWLIGGRGRDLYFAGEDDISFARFWETVEAIEAEAPVA